MSVETKSKLPEVWLENNAQYSELFREMMQHLENDEVMMNYHFSPDDPEVPLFLRQYRYRVASWPMIISRQKMQEFNDFVTPLADICYRCVKLFFKDDSQKFAEYLNMPSVVYDLLKDTKVDPRELLMRCDYIYSNNTCKLLEFNVGTAVGGWEHDWLIVLFERSMKLSQSTANWDLTYRNVIKKTLSSMCDTIKRTKPSAKGNVLMCLIVDTMTQDEIDSFKTAYAAIYRQVKSFTEGDVYFCDDFDQIEFKAGGSVAYKGKEMDAVMISVDEEIPIPTSLMLRLVGAHMSGNIALPDNPMYTVLGNKMLLAILHEKSVQEQLDEKDREYIKKHIPWTVKSNCTEVEFEGKTHFLTDLLINQKDRFVIKKGNSKQGKHVYIGCTTDVEEWRSIVAKFGNDNAWLVQEFYEPENIIACDDKSQLGVFKPVWGVYCLNNSYAGSVVRAIPVGEEGAGNGVINSAGGAYELPVYEENKLTKTIIL